jgi:hypothetical protein
VLLQERIKREDMAAKWRGDPNEPVEAVESGRRDQPSEPNQPPPAAPTEDRGEPVVVHG